MRRVVPMALLALAGSARAEYFDVFTRVSLSPSVEQMRIDRPNPTRPSTDYPDVVFRPGDAVTIQAGGCVQSGGTGPTWHRYVDPSGPNSERLYQGLITIPFATGRLEPIRNYQAKTVHIPASAPAEALHLQLGFVDDEYDDNGYYEHDDGPDGQCMGPSGGAAWVALTIDHTGGAQGPPPVSLQTEWDLKWTEYDDNGIPLNPQWSAQQRGRLFPNPLACEWPWSPYAFPISPCTSQWISLDTYTLCETFSAALGFGGHANWLPATYSGTLLWGEKSIPTQDDEYSLDLVTSGAAGAAAGSPVGPHIEFDSDETVDTLVDDFRLPWWSQLRRAVDRGDGAAHDFVDDSFAVVVGLIGVDFAHTPGTESHPVWAIAVRDKHENLQDDTWAFFVRNWGNEGYCSGDQHYVAYADGRFVFRIPWQPGADSVEIIPDKTIFRATSGIPDPTIKRIPGEAVLVTFTRIPDATARPLIGGEVHLRWGGATTRSAHREVHPTAKPLKRNPERADTALNEALRQLSEPGRRHFAEVTRSPRRHRTVVSLHYRVEERRGVPRVRGIPRVWSAPDPDLVRRKDRALEALLHASGGNIPGIRTKPAARR